MRVSLGSPARIQGTRVKKCAALVLVLAVMFLALTAVAQEPVGGRFDALVGSWEAGFVAKFTGTTYDKVNMFIEKIEDDGTVSGRIFVNGREEAPKVWRAARRSGNLSLEWRSDEYTFTGKLVTSNWLFGPYDWKFSNIRGPIEISFERAR